MSDGTTAVVLLHGECEDGSVWAAVTRLLREAGVDVTAPALRGSWSAGWLRGMAPSGFAESGAAGFQNCCCAVGGVKLGEDV